MCTVNSTAVRDPPVINCHNISTPSLHPAASLVHSEPFFSVSSCLLGVWAHLSSTLPSILPSLSPSPPCWHPISSSGAWFLYTATALTLSSALLLLLPLQELIMSLITLRRTKKTPLFYCSNKSIAHQFAVYSKKDNKLVQWTDFYRNYSWDKHTVTMRSPGGKAEWKKM